MHKPVSPCRRTCSSVHGQSVQAEQSYYEKIARINQGQTKILLLEDSELNEVRALSNLGKFDQVNDDLPAHSSRQLTAD